MALCGGIVLEEALDLFDRLLMMMMMMMIYIYIGHIYIYIYIYIYIGLKPVTLLEVVATLDEFFFFYYIYK